MYSLYGGDSTGNLTASANTHIQFLIPPSGPAPAGTVNSGKEIANGPIYAGVTRVTALTYYNDATLHTVYLARPIGKTKVQATAAGGTVALNLAIDPGLAANNNLAANDLLAIRESDGVTRLYKVNNIASPQILNLTSALVCGVLNNADVWNFGIVTDTDPATGVAHPRVGQTLNTITTYTGGDAGTLAPTKTADTPILFDSANQGPGAGIVDLLAWAYSRYAWVLALGLAAASMS